MAWNVYARGMSVAWLDGGGSAPAPGPASKVAWSLLNRGGQVVDWSLRGSTAAPPPPSPAGAVNWSVQTRGMGRSIVWRGMPVAGAAPGQQTDAGRQRAGRGRRRLYLGEPDRNDSAISDGAAPLEAKAPQPTPAPVPQQSAPPKPTTAPAAPRKTIAEALPVPVAAAPAVMTAEDGASILREAIQARQTAEVALALVQAALDDMEAMQAAAALLDS